MADPDVERWLDETNPKLAPAMSRIAEIILGADPRMRTYVKYGTVQFASDGDMAAFVQPKGPRISLMFNRGARIPGDFPHLEGDGPTARFIRFADLAEVEERAEELAAITRAWCELEAR
jgi:hypothetical protein